MHLWRMPGRPKMWQSTMHSANSTVLSTAGVQQLCSGQSGDRGGARIHDAAVVQFQAGQAGITQVAAQSLSGQPQLVHDGLDAAS